MLDKDFGTVDWKAMEEKVKLFDDFMYFFFFFLTLFS